MINLTIVKTELRRSLNTNLIWAVTWALVGLMMLSLYDLVSATSADILTVFEAYPKEFLDLFGIEAQRLSTVEGFFALEFFLMYMLAAGIFGAFQGTNTVGKEISNRTIHFLVAKPVTRVNIFVSKFLVIAFYALATNLTIAAFTFIGGKIAVETGVVGGRFLLLSFIVAAIFQIVFASLTQFLSTILDEGKAFLAGAAVVVIGIILDTVSNLDNAPEILKYLSPYFYVDIDHIVDLKEIQTPEIFVPLLVIPVLIAFGAWWFRKSDIHI